MDIIVLVNSEDEKCRDFVKSIPANGDNTYCFIDWYKQPEEIISRTCKCHFGQPYKGPSPSAFPELVYLDDDPPDDETINIMNKKVSKKPVDPGWARVRCADSVLDVLDRNKIDCRKPDNSIPKRVKPKL